MVASHGTSCGAKPPLHAVGGAVLALVVAVGLGCAAEQGAAPGQLTIALTTNLTPGVDFDELRMVVRRDDLVLQDLPFAWPRGGAGTPPMRFPATYTIVNRTSGNPSVSVRFEAKQGGRLRIVRDAKTVLPTSGDLVLPVLLDWLCLDKLPASTPTDVQCRETETCVAGACVTPTVDGTTLRPYEPGEIFGGATSAGSAGNGTCFDVLGTFNGATTYAPDRNGACGIGWGTGDANLNVGVALPPGTAGSCYTSGGGGCLVALEKGGASGWSVANGRLTVPARVCGTANARVAVVQGKPTKAANQPPCGAFSSVGSPDAGTAPTATIVVTEADAGVRDAGTNGGAPDGATVDAGASDAGAPDGGPADPCAGYTCPGAPAATCMNGTTRRTFSGPGTCSSASGSAQCMYSHSDAACAAASCTNGVATAASACSGGACVAGVQTSCAFGCSGSVCSGCTGETDAVFCARLGAACGSRSGTDNCGAARTVTSCGTCGGGQTCSSGTCTGATSGSELGATTAGMTGDGLDNCGPSGNDVCARSLLATGGTFNRGTGTSYPATVSDFRLDKYEVTVGRFRKFVDAWVGGWRPGVGAGKHTHLNGGAGLVNTAGGNEPGWASTWTDYVGAPGAIAVTPTGAGATTKAAWDTNLSCANSFQTWTSAAGPHEKWPQNCLSWYDLHAFCIWDGGFLPSEAEWEYAAAGGNDERTYPWGNTTPSANTGLAIYGCYLNGTGPGTCSGTTNIATVGTLAAGASKYGQLDLAGNVWEWNLDWYQSPFVAQCNNCTNLTASSDRAVRGGSFSYGASGLPAAGRYLGHPASRVVSFAGRCARSP